MPRPPRVRAESRRPSLADVARAAGVSAQTVSRVVNDGPGVGAETRRRVRALLDEVGYWPNSGARALTLGTGTSIHVLTAEVSLYGQASILKGIGAAAVGHGHQLVVTVLDGEGDLAAAVAAAAAAAPCVVFALDAVGAGAARLLPAGAVAVVVGDDRVDVDEEVTPVRRRRTVVRMEEEVAAERATEHLLDLGHDTVHHLSVPVGARRTAGWRHALAAAGCRASPPEPGGWTALSAAAATDRLLAREPDLTALFCGNDDQALGALHTLRRTGRRVPDDVSVVGFDDVPGAACFAPPLTTVNQDFHRLGVVAAERLLDLVAGVEAVEAGTDLAGELVVRGSSGPPPVR